MNIISKIVRWAARKQNTSRHLYALLSSPCRQQKMGTAREACYRYNNQTHAAKKLQKKRIKNGTEPKDDKKGTGIKEDKKRYGNQRGLKIVRKPKNITSCRQLW